MKRLDPQFVTAQIHSLLARYPELAEDETLRLDSIEAETDAKTLLEQLVRKKAEADAYSVGIKSYQDELQVRRARMERRSEAAKELMFKIMEAADLLKIELAEATLAIRNGAPKVIITDETALPEQFVKVERTPKKSEIAKALKDGVAVPGASLSNAEPSLTVRMA
jgi:hypothetical protein